MSATANIVDKTKGADGAFRGLPRIQGVRAITLGGARGLRDRRCAPGLDWTPANRIAGPPLRPGVCASDPGGLPGGAGLQTDPAPPRHVGAGAAVRRRRTHGDLRLVVATALGLCAGVLLGPRPELAGVDHARRRHARRRRAGFPEPSLRHVLRPSRARCVGGHISDVGASDAAAVAQLPHRGHRDPRVGGLHVHLQRDRGNQLWLPQPETPDRVTAGRIGPMARVSARRDRHRRCRVGPDDVAVGADTAMDIRARLWVEFRRRFYQRGRLTRCRLAVLYLPTWPKQLGTKGTAAKGNNPHNAHTAGYSAAPTSAPNSEGPAAAITRCVVFWMPKARPLQNGPANSVMAVASNPLSSTATTEMVSMSNTLSVRASRNRLDAAMAAMMRTGCIRDQMRSDQWPTAIRPIAPSSCVMVTKPPAAVTDQ